MNKYGLYETIAEEYTLTEPPDGDVTFIVRYDWGDEIMTGTATVASETASVEVPGDLINAVGVYRIYWFAELNGAPVKFVSSFDVYSQYITDEEFVSIYPEYDATELLGNEDKFNNLEIISRKIIDTYAGQSFHPIMGKALTFSGNGKNKIKVGQRLNHINSAFINGEDVTERVSVDRDSKRFVNIREGKFFDKADVVINGDWGWYSVPENIKQAAGLMIIDLEDDIRRETFRYGISRVWQDTSRFEFKEAFFDTSGNIDVDILLMDYIHWTMDYVT
jgi:hypothetical protein